MGCFAGPNAEDFAKAQLQYIEKISADSKESQARVAAICLALSCLSMERPLAAKLCFVGITLAFFTKQTGSCTMDLVANAMRNFGEGNPFTSEFIPEELTEYIETCTDLPFSSDFFYSMFMMIAQFCDGGNTESVARAISARPVKDVFCALIRGIYDSTGVETLAHFNYESRLAAVEAAACMIFKHAPGLHWDEFLEKITDAQPEGYKEFDSGYPPFAKGVAEAAKSPHLMGLLTNMRDMKNNDEDMNLPAILYSNFSSEMEPILLSEDRIQYLVLTLFSDEN